MSGGGSGGGSSTQTQRVDPEMMKLIQGNLGQIDQLGFTPFKGSGVVGFTPQMRNTMNQMQQMGQQGRQLMGQGANTLQGVAGTQAQQISPSGQVGDIGLQGLDMAQFQDPFQRQVIDQAISDIDRSRQMAIGGVGDSAIGSGAFGGSRHGVMEAETNRAAMDQAARTSAQLGSQGFNTALQAAQQQQGMGLQADLANMQGQQFNIGTDLAAQQANQGAGLDAARLQMLAGQGLLGAGQGMFGMGQQASGMTQDMAQAQRDFQIQQHMMQQQFPMDKAALRTSAIQGMPFMGSTTMQQPGGSRAGSALGGGLSGAAMGAQMGSVIPGLGTAWGAGIGGGIGLLGGMFG